jgi:hypothetical protein
VHSIPDELFFYLNRDRGLLYKNRNQIDNTISPFAFFRELFFHQLNVSKISLKIVARSNFNIIKKLFIYVYILVCTVYFSMGYIVAIPTVRFFKKTVVLSFYPQLKNYTDSTQEDSYIQIHNSSFSPTKFVFDSYDKFISDFEKNLKPINRKI